MGNLENLKLPPHSIEAEQSVLGAIILANDAFDIVLEKKVRPEHFYNRSHAMIFDAMISLTANCRPIDLVTLEEELERNGNVEQAGGFVYVGEIARNTPSAANVSTYCDIVIERAQKRNLIGAANEIADMCYANEGVSIEQITASSEKLVMEVSDSLIDETQDLSAEAGLADVIQDMENQIKHDKPMGVSSGISDYDRKIGLYQPGLLYLVAARPSMGKTSFILNGIADEIRKGGAPIFFSCESPRKEMFKRLLSIMSKVELSRIKSPSDKSAGLHDEHWGRIANAMPVIKSSLLQVDDSTGQTVHHMRSRINRFKRDNGKYPTAVYVDYLQIIRESGKYSDNRTKAVGDIAQGLKDIAKDFSIPVICLSQLNRSLENRSCKRPVNSDLRESGEIEQVSDVITFLYRDEVYNPDSPNKGLCELIISKNRDGEIGMVGAQFEGQFVSFSDVRSRTFVDYQSGGGDYFK